MHATAGRATDDTTALILQPRSVSAAKADTSHQEEGRPARKLSKAQKRKWQKVQEDKVKRKERAQVKLPFVWKFWLEGDGHLHSRAV